MYNCKLCGGINSLIKDYNSNLIKCNICDTTIKENDNDEINEFQKYFASNDKTIEYMNTLEEDNTIPQKIHKSKNQNKKDSNPIETKMNNKIEEISKKMDLSESIKEKVKDLTKKVLDSKKIKFKLLESVIASVIFVVCRNGEEPKTMQEISTQLDIDRRAVNRCYNSIKDIIAENKNQIPETVSRLINSYCDKILNDNNETLKKLSCDISNNVCKYELISGRNPTTIAATCILIGATLLKLNIGKKIISKKVRTTENTINNAYCVLKDYIDCIVPSEYKNDISLLNGI
jgi:transcription initiation factor TFIIIB Brf1 subunit/transcription initiation factor TFIIB